MRFIFYLIAAVLIITVLRSIVGTVLKGFAGLLNPRAPTPRRPEAPSLGGELKKDPVCGTFIATSTAFKKTVGAQTYYFCSAACRDKFSSPAPSGRG